MSDVTDTLPIYENMALISQQMVDAARQSDWDLLSVLERRSSAYVDQLKRNGASDAPDGNDEALRQRKITLINKILADDRDIRDLTEPWMKHLSNLIQNTSNERKLVQAYGVSQER